MYLPVCSAQSWVKPTVDHRRRCTDKLLAAFTKLGLVFQNPLPSFHPFDLLVGAVAGCAAASGSLVKNQKREKVPARRRIRHGPVECIILSVKDTYMDAQEVMHMTDYSKITAPLLPAFPWATRTGTAVRATAYRTKKSFWRNYARGQHLTNIRHYIDDDESGRFFDRSAYSRMMDDVENGKIGVCIMKDLTPLGARLSPSWQRYGDIQTEQCALYRGQQRG